jgi:hypothetical protein
VSIAQDDDLLAALQSIGYSMRLVPSPGAGYHHTYAVLYDATGTMLTHLPVAVAQKLHETFTQRPNPFRGRRIP